MTTHVFSSANIGLGGQIVDIECDLNNGLPTIVIVGLANKSVDESKERIKSAITNSGFSMPRKRITLNLAPADLPKEGSGYDLGMAMAILTASEQLKSSISNTIFIGELSLDGQIRRVPGILSHIQNALDAGFKNIVIPSQNINQARLLADKINIIPCSTLKEVFLILSKTKTPRVLKRKDIDHRGQIEDADLTIEDINGQDSAKRALQIAAAGGHNILISGPPGAGKTMLAKALVSILPPPSLEEIIQVTNIHSLSGTIMKDVIITRPFRSPHHTSSQVALVGGGKKANPGEISLSHKGVLFLDEIPEFNRSVLEALRQPLEDNLVTVSRADRKVSYPADFMLVATQNPCPCGYFGDTTKECTCSSTQILQYNKKLSGPLLDRIDLIIYVDRVESSNLLSERQDSQLSQEIRTKIIDAKEKQRQRFDSTLKTNSSMTNRDIKKISNLTPESKDFLESAAEKLGLTARSYMKTIKVSRTIADLDNQVDIEPSHVGEALQYRLRTD